MFGFIFSNEVRTPAREDTKPSPPKSITTRTYNTKGHQMKWHEIGEKYGYPIAFRWPKWKDGDYIIARPIWNATPTVIVKPKRMKF